MATSRIINSYITLTPSQVTKSITFGYVSYPDTQPHPAIVDVIAAQLTIEYYLAHDFTHVSSNKSEIDLTGRVWCQFMYVRPSVALMLVTHRGVTYCPTIYPNSKSLQPTTGRVESRALVWGIPSGHCSALAKTLFLMRVVDGHYYWRWSENHAASENYSCDTRRQVTRDNSSYPVVECNCSWTFGSIASRRK